MSASVRALLGRLLRLADPLLWWTLLRRFVAPGNLQNVRIGCGCLTLMLVGLLLSGFLVAILRGVVPLARDFSLVGWDLAFNGGEAVQRQLAHSPWLGGGQDRPFWAVSGGFQLDEAVAVGKPFQIRPLEGCNSEVRVALSFEVPCKREVALKVRLGEEDVYFPGDYQDDGLWAQQLRREQCGDDMVRETYLVEELGRYQLDCVPLVFVRGKASADLAEVSLHITSSRLVGVSD